MTLKYPNIVDIWWSPVFSEQMKEWINGIFEQVPSYGIRIAGLFLCGHFNTEVTVFESGQTAILALATLFLTLIDVVVFLGWIDHGHESDDGSFQGAYGWTMSPSHLVIMVFHYGNDMTHGMVELKILIWLHIIYIIHMMSCPNSLIISISRPYRRKVSERSRGASDFDRSRSRIRIDYLNFRNWFLSVEPVILLKCTASRF